MSEIRHNIAAYLEDMDITLADKIVGVEELIEDLINTLQQLKDI